MVGAGDLELTTARFDLLGGKSLWPPKACIPLGDELHGNR